MLSECSAPNILFSEISSNLFDLSVHRKRSGMSAVGYSWEENLIAFYILSEDSDYLDVQFDWMSGGLSAIHKDHRFDKSVGPFGCKRGDYERHVTDLMRNNGHRIILLSEDGHNSLFKQFDGLLDGLNLEIKAVEGNGRWSTRTKIYDAVKQGAESLILYYPDVNLFNYKKVLESWLMYEKFSKQKTQSITRVIAVINDAMIEIVKPPR